MDEKQFAKLIDRTLAAMLDMSQGQAAEFAGKVLSSCEISRTVTESVLAQLTPEDREEFVLQVEALSEEGD